MSYEAPFAGVKVVDLSQGIAAPYAGMLLAQHGALVIKVEVLDGGDWVRAIAPIPGGNTALSVMGNLGKQSIGLNLKSPEGCAVLWRLLDGADIFMEGFRPGVIGRNPRSSVLRAIDCRIASACRSCGRGPRIPD